MRKTAYLFVSFACQAVAFIMLLCCLWVPQGSKIEVQNWVIIQLCYGICFAVAAKGESDA